MSTSPRLSPSTTVSANPWREGSVGTFSPTGDWSMRHLESIVSALRAAPPSAATTIDGSGLNSLDTAGAMLILQASGATPPVTTLTLSGFAPNHRKVMELVLERFRPIAYPQPQASLPLVQEVGKSAIEVSDKVQGFLSFFGEAALALLRIIKEPRLLRTRELFVQLERVCVYAIPIVSLVTFLIGVVVAYLSATQLQKYGANIFLVDGVGLTMARELSPVLVAIIVAGRSGSAFTAQIGAMKINEEIDALQALGLSSMQVLVLPRLFALIIAMPLLTFVGDLVGIAGGALIANNSLGITPTTFYERLQTVLPLRAYLVGIGKAPVFAIVIALIGCRMGLKVENTATSVGINTTSTVVQSIVAVILLDAAFAVVFQKLGI